MAPACPAVSEGATAVLWFIMLKGPEEKFFLLYMWVCMRVGLIFFPEVLYVSEGRRKF